MNKEKKIHVGRILCSIIILIIIILAFYFIYNTTKEENNIVNNSSYISQTTNIAEPQENTINETNIEPEKIDWEWQYDTLENQNIDRDVIESLHTTLDSTNVQSMVIVRNENIVDEYYKDGYDKNSIFTLQSCSKSITSAIMGIAIDKGYIESVNVPISNYFPQILESGSDYQKQITIWHLLTHTSGINASDTYNWDAWRNSDNWVDYVLSRGVTSRPGTVFNYFTGNTHLLAAIIEQATGQSLYDFGKEYLFAPLGMDSVSVSNDPQGIADGGNGFAMNVYDMAKFGQLYLNNGVWNGEQIISNQWIKDSTTVQFTRSSGTADYGYQWWVRTFGNNNYHAYFAQGHFGQYIFVVPDLELVIVFTSHHDGSSNIYWEFVNNIVNATR